MTGLGGDVAPHVALELPRRYRHRTVEGPSLDEFTAATYNVAKGSQRRMDAIIGDIMKLHNALWGSEGRHGRKRRLVVGLQEVGNWRGRIQPKTHKHFSFFGQPGRSDCGFIFPRDLIDKIIKVCWGSRYCIVATTRTIFVSMHLVWTEEAADTIEQIHYEIQNIQMAFPKCSEMIFCSDSNVSLRKNSTTDCRGVQLTGRSVLETQHPHRNRQEFLAMLSGYGAHVASTFGDATDSRLIHTWIRNRKKTDSMQTDTSQIDHISITPGLENVRNMVGTWVEQQNICKTREWIIRRSDHWPVLQALRWRGTDGAFSGGDTGEQRSFVRNQNTISLQGFEPFGGHTQHGLPDELNYCHFLFQRFRSVPECCQN